MGAGSSKPQQQQPPPIGSSGGTIKRSRHQSSGPTPSAPKGSDTTYGSYSTTPQALQRSQSARQAYDLAGVTERRDKRALRAFASEDAGPVYSDPANTGYGSQRLRNPLPAPPKDIFAPSPEFEERPLYDERRMRTPHPQNPHPSPNEFSRVQFSNPPPFIPISPDELNRRRKASLRDKGRASQGGGKVVPVHRIDPSSSLSSHSSVSTSNPPAQVVSSSVGNFTVLQNGKKHHDPGSTGNSNFKTRKKGFFSSLRPSFSSPPKEEPAALIVPPAIRSHQPLSPASHLSISHPHQLVPRLTPITRPPIPFYYPEEPHSSFTTFSPHKILYKKRLYHTAEHLYQAMKFLPDRGNRGDPEAAEQIRNCSEYPGDAVLQGRLLNKKAKPDWRAMRTVWMDEILYLKFTQHPDLRHELISTAPAELVFVSPIDPYWGIGPEARGQNELGEALVRVRTRIMHEMEQ
ncbi:hypothetical protein FRB98_003458 [Tulasnella sp. 332]|nr:hypothetical protein FRB98_003458 [Tulasnella sp. 332]